MAVGYGKKKTKVAVVVSYEQYRMGENRKIGVLEGRARYRVGKNFRISDEELLSL